MEGAKVAAVLLLCVALNACAGVVSAGAGSPGGSSDPVVSLSTSLLAFGSQTVGTTSGAQTVTLTNTSTSMLKVTGIAASGDFTETNTCGANVSAGSSCTISASFIPGSTGTLTGSLTITDNAVSNPQSVSLTGAGTTTGGGSGGGGGGSGGGTGTPGTGCTGTPLAQTQTDVTSKLSYANTAAGVKVTQLTSNATNRFYYFDVPAYSPLVNQILYVNSVSLNNVVTSDTGGSNAGTISPTNIGVQAFLSGDGSLAYYDKPVKDGTPGGVDLYGMLLNTAGTCQELRLTTVDLPVQEPLSVEEISSSSPDPAGGLDIAFSPDTLVHRVHVQTDGSSEILPTITLNDPENNATMHRLRMNPKFPNIIMYKRNQTGGSTAQPEVWLVDLNTCPNGICAAGAIINIVANLPTPQGQTPEGGHTSWSPDGLDIAFSEPDIADYWIARNVVNADGSMNAGFTLQELGPFVKPQITADYCAFPPDWPASTVLACLAGPASTTDAKALYLMSSDGLGTMKMLAATDAPVLTIYGTPMPQYAQDNTHLMFNSDRTGIPQIYLVSGFTASVP
jgi:hypothetical protein